MENVVNSCLLIAAVENTLFAQPPPQMSVESPLQDMSHAFPFIAAVS